MVRMRILVATFTMICAWSCVNAQSVTTHMSLPAPTGTYGIGIVHYLLVDQTRPEPLPGAPETKRQIMVHVWYPVDSRTVAGRKTMPYLPDLQEALPKLSSGDVKGLFRPSSFKGVDALPATGVVENSPIAAGTQHFPLLVFSHGWGNPTFLYTAELQDLVSHGYIVAAVDHPYDTAYTRFPDGTITLFAQDRFNQQTKVNGLNAYAKERVEIMGDDNRFALTEVLRYATQRSLNSPFYNRVDIGRIGAFGHSIGGLAAARTCQIDTRVRACLDEDSDDSRGSPFIATPINQTEKQPFLLFVVASADLWSPAIINPSDADLAAQKMTRAEYGAVLRSHQETETEQLASIPGGSYRIKLFGVPGFSHRSFTDQTLLDFSTNANSANVHNLKIAEAYIQAFFDKCLKGDMNTVLDSNTPVDPRAIIDHFPEHR